MADIFDDACDRLSADVDDVQFERLRWARDEGPKLARLLELAQGAVKKRDDFELNEEGASSDIKRFVLKVHGNRIASVAVGLENGQVIATVGAIERSAFVVKPGDPIVDDYANVDEGWMAKTLSELFSRISAPKVTEPVQPEPTSPEDHQSQ